MWKNYETNINYQQNGPNDDRNRLFDMYHLKTDDGVKEYIYVPHIRLQMTIYMLFLILRPLEWS